MVLEDEPVSQRGAEAMVMVWALRVVQNVGRWETHFFVDNSAARLCFGFCVPPLGNVYLQGQLWV